jgi:hypothetical protein
MKRVLRKLGSVKVWIALWSMLLINYIVVMDRAGFNNLAMMALAPIIAFLGANVWQKKKCREENKEGSKDEGCS